MNPLMCCVGLDNLPICQIDFLVATYWKRSFLLDELQKLTQTDAVSIKWSLNPLWLGIDPPNENPVNAACLPIPQV